MPDSIALLSDWYLRKARLQFRECADGIKRVRVHRILGEVQGMAFIADSEIDLGQHGKVQPQECPPFDSILAFRAVHMRAPTISSIVEAQGLRPVVFDKLFGPSSACY